MRAQSEFQRWRARAGLQWQDCCPFCGVVMVRSPGKGSGRRLPPAMRTRAHLRETNHHQREPEHWVHACQSCNGDQGRLALDEWLLVLDHRRDPRADAVRAVVAALREGGWL